jgi:ubiquitin C-terminal hydrolase
MLTCTLLLGHDSTQPPHQGTPPAERAPAAAAPGTSCSIPRAPPVRLPPGLTNEGANCFLNVVLQCLRAAPGLTKQLRALREAPTGDDVAKQLASELAGKLAALLRRMSEVRLSTVEFG